MFRKKSLEILCSAHIRFPAFSSSCPPILRNWFLPCILLPPLQEKKRSGHNHEHILGSFLFVVCHLQYNGRNSFLHFFISKQVTAFNIPIAFSIKRKKERETNSGREIAYKQQSFDYFHRYLCFCCCWFYFFVTVSHFNRNGFYMFAGRTKREKTSKKPIEFVKRISSFIFISFVWLGLA